MTAATVLGWVYLGLFLSGVAALVVAGTGGARARFVVSGLLPSFAAIVVVPLAYEAARRLGGLAGLEGAQARWAAGGLAVLVLYAVLSETARSVLAQAAIIAVPLGALALALLDSLVERMSALVAVSGQGVSGQGVAGQGMAGQGVAGAGASPALLVGAVVTGSVVALGWVFTYALQEFRRADERAQAVDDLLDALRAEIVDYLTDVSRGKLDRSMPETLARIVDDPGFVPFLPTGRDAVVFDALKDRLHLMPAAATDPVVQFYVQLQDIHVMSKDLQSPEFRTLPADRMAAAYRHYMELRTDADELAKEAFWAILTEQNQFPPAVFARMNVDVPKRYAGKAAFSSSRSAWTGLPQGAGSADRGTVGR